jgi:hypothetical protein
LQEAKDFVQRLSLGILFGHHVNVRFWQYNVVGLLLLRACSWVSRGYPNSGYPDNKYLSLERLPGGGVAAASSILRPFPIFWRLNKHSSKMLPCNHP